MFVERAKERRYASNTQKWECQKLPSQNKAVFFTKTQTHNTPSSDDKSTWVNNDNQLCKTYAKYKRNGCASDCKQTNGISDCFIKSTTWCDGNVDKTKAFCAMPNSGECVIVGDYKELPWDSKPSDIDPSFMYAGWANRSDQVMCTSNPSIQCHYNMDKIQTEEQMRGMDTQFADSSDPTTQAALERVRINYCSGALTDGCPLDPVTHARASVCSRMIGGNKDDYCHQWMGNAKKGNYIGALDTAKTNFCSAHPDTWECECINRANNKIYSSLWSAESNVNDRCWWLPCKNSDRYLVTDDVESKPCATTVCQTMTNIWKSGGDVNINDVNLYTNCKIGGGTPPGPPSNGGDGTNFFKKYWLDLTIGGSAIVLVLLASLLLFFLMK